MNLNVPIARAPPAAARRRRRGARRARPAAGTQARGNRHRQPHAPNARCRLAAEFADAAPIRGCGLDTPGAGFDLIINGTSASLAGELPALPRDVVQPDTVCYDMAYGHEDTVFVRWARAQGAARAVMGLGMLVEQAAESFLLWRGVRPETAPVLAALQRE